MSRLQWVTSWWCAVALFFTGCVKNQAEAPVAPPVISQFTADKSRISKGGTVTLSFEVERAESLTLTDQLGSPVALSGDSSKGTATVAPQASAVYLLSAKGKGGLDAAFVQVAVDEGLKSVFLVAVPPVVKAGESSSLVFSAFGGTNVKLSAPGGEAIDVGGKESGVVTVTPARTTRYELRAEGASNGALTATATVQVGPVITELTSSPPVAKPGQTISLEWKTKGAEAVVLTERTFGALPIDSTAAENGSYDFTVPVTFAATDAGTPVLVPIGYPLSFTLTASTLSPAQSTTKTIQGAVGEGPIIFELNAPEFATVMKPLTVSWRTNASRVEVLADNLLVFAPAAGQLTSGSADLPAPTVDTTITLVAYDFNGFQVRQSKQVKVVMPPKVNSFTLPVNLSTAGTGAMATWSTSNAVAVVVRHQNGPSAFVTTDAAKATQGTGTVYPTRTETFVLEAYNVAGSVATAERTIQVGGPITLSAMPSISAANADVTLSWDLTAQMPGDVVGAPGPGQRQMATNGFVDISVRPDAHTITFSDENDAVSLVEPPQGFTYPLLGDRYTRFWVSTNGVIGLKAIPPLPTNADLSGPPTGTMPQVLAPFWDDLNLLMSDATEPGSVQWVVDGSTYPRRLIIQWSKVRIASDVKSRLTFQARLSETGGLTFSYLTLTNGDATLSQGQQATVGINFGPGRFNERIAFNPMTTAAVSQGDELTWFVSTATTGTATARAFESFEPGLFYSNAASGNWAYATAKVRVFAPGSVVVNEVMPVGPTSVVAGQWVELFNPSPVSLDIGGLELVSSAAPMAPWAIPADTLIPGNGYLVLGQSTSPAENDDAGVALAWSSMALPFDAADAGVSLRAPLTMPVQLSSLTWRTADAGVSVQKDSAIGANGPLVCARTRTYGAGSIGTPGAANESCFEYRLTPIAAAYQDISGTGTAVVTNGDYDESIFTVSLPKPFKYFGTNQSTLTVSTNGWVGFGSYTVVGTANKVAPSASAPAGTIAPFWDDLEGALGASNVFFQRMSDHSIVQWHQYSHYFDFDDLNFQVKLFDTGVIEFHYSTMEPGPYDAASDGSTATIWVERPDGTAALPVGINQAVIAPHTAYRLTPQ